MPVRRGASAIRLYPLECTTDVGRGHEVGTVEILQDCAMIRLALLFQKLPSMMGLR